MYLDEQQAYLLSANLIENFSSIILLFDKYFDCVTQVIAGTFVIWRCTDY